MAKINLERFSWCTGDIGDYTYKSAAENAKLPDAAKENKEAFVDLKKPLDLPPGDYNLQMHARGYVDGYMKVTAATTPNDILRAMSKYFKGHCDTYMDSFEVDTTKKIIKAEFGT